MSIYQFTSHSNLPADSPQPQHRMFDFYNRLLAGEELSDKEQLLVVNTLYGICTGGHHDSTFKFGGFAAPFHNVLKRFLVKRYGSWQEYYSFDEKALYAALDDGDEDPDTMIEEIVAAPRTPATTAE